MPTLDGLKEKAAMIGERLKGVTGGAVGAGLVLVFVPCLALVGMMRWFAATPIIGLPILAIFGIMILFGALSLIASLFAGLDLADRDQPLGLPDGSIRATIALSLIVLFAIISIMLYQSISKPYVMTKISPASKDLMVKEAMNRIVAIEPECPGGAATCENPPSYSVHVLQPQGQEATDLAKQLLILIGTLMTSVTSFYFASRGNDLLRADKTNATTTNGEGAATDQTGAANAEAADVDDDAESAVDGCNVAIDHATADEDLPAAHGGVEAR